MSQLTTTQEQVLTLLAQGSTVAAAAQVDLALYWHEQLLAFGDRAIQTLDRIFSDENESSGVQLRDRRRQHQQPPVESQPSTINEQDPTPNPSESDGRPVATPQPRPDRTKLHNTAPEPGRNALCPCGSGLKYKRCCLSKSELQARAA
ncbi:SEC-C metal-binding domain-containing protein [Nevskia soli]|uniref:SEC-C metal-binding domain-containing protein n=1 Tax=Nevskia soli TaxID=418856 RepID=UPI0015D8E144|nr:SEC-C domain-containing protein [Nevskia soli]